MKAESLKAKLPKGVKGITILKTSPSQTASGGVERIVMRRKRKTKKQSKGLIRVLERLVRRRAKSDERTSESYLARHRRSNRKRRDGWMRDLPYNLTRASRTGSKQLKLSKLFG